MTDEEIRKIRRTVKIFNRLARPRKLWHKVERLVNHTQELRDLLDEVLSLAERAREILEPPPQDDPARCDYCGREMTKEKREKKKITEDQNHAEYADR